MTDNESIKQTVDLEKSSVEIRNVVNSDLDRCFEIESYAYAGDEAASIEKIAHRINTYPEGFIVLTVGGIIAGFINGGATHEIEMSDESFKELIGHDANGRHIVIMSVVIHPDYQRLGLASKLMNNYIERMRDLKKESMFLICQTDLIDMYASYGFQYLRNSTSNHGGLSWHDMSLQL